jgi:hypothetical protein
MKLHDILKNLSFLIVAAAEAAEKQKTGRIKRAREAFCGGGK